MQSQNQHGPAALLRSVWHHLFRPADHAAGELYQTSVMSALIDGVYEGDVTYGELHQHGDFGLGTFNALDGEMVGFDGVFYQLRSDGSARPVSDEQKTPFAIVTFFRPERTLPLPGTMTKAALVAFIETVTDANLFTALRIDGVFEEVRTRTVGRQQKPFPSLTEATAHEATNSLTNMPGTLAGFRTPAYAGGIGVGGMHLHFLNAQRNAGGHALDFTIREGNLQLATLRDFHVELPRSSEFLHAKLDDPSVLAKIKKSEG